MRTVKSIALIVLLAILQFISIRYAGYSIRVALVDTVTLFILATVFVFLISTIQQYYHSKVALNGTNVSSLLLFTCLTIAAHYFISYGFFSGHSFEKFLKESIPYKAAFVALVYVVGLLLSWIDQQKKHERRIQEFALQKEREGIQIELNSVQQQFKPHFLFNSLNSINALTISNPEEARRMVHLLSEFMRAAVKEDQSEMITLEQEIHHIKLYTDIEKVRFGSRLSIIYNIDEEALSKRLPSLILQPLIENAIKYGLYGHTDQVEIRINAHVETNKLLVSISNPYDAEIQSSVKGTGYGLQSIEKKMLILYSQANLLQLNKENGEFKATLNIPQR